MLQLQIPTHVLNILIINVSYAFYPAKILTRFYVFLRLSNILGSQYTQHQWLSLP